MGARMMGMGNSNATLTDEWTIFNNIGGLGRVKQTNVLFGYDARPALIGANRMGTGMTLPFAFGTFGLGVHRFGDNLYSEQLISAGFGNQFGNTSLGVRVNYIQYRAENFGTQSAFSVDFGGITQLSSQFYAGASITNVTQSALNHSGTEKLPTRMTAGIGFKPEDKIWISTELEKDIDYKPTWRVGLEYLIYKKIAFRTGYNLYPSALFFGTGFQKRNLKIDYALKLAELTGTAHQASASYIIAQKEKK